MPPQTKQPTEKSGQEKARLSALRNVIAGWLFACKDSFTAFEVAIKLFTSYEATGVVMGKFSDEVTDKAEIGVNIGLPKGYFFTNCFATPISCNEPLSISCKYVPEGLDTIQKRHLKHMRPLWGRE